MACISDKKKKNLKDAQNSNLKQVLESVLVTGSKSGIRFWFWAPEVPFLGTQNAKKNTILGTQKWFHQISKKWSNENEKRTLFLNQCCDAVSKLSVFLIWPFHTSLGHSGPNLGIRPNKFIWNPDYDDGDHDWCPRVPRGYLGVLRGT